MDMALTTHEQKSTLRVLAPNGKQSSYFNVFDFEFNPRDHDVVLTYLEAKI